MKVRLIQSTDGFDKPNGAVIEDIVINEEVTTTGVTQGEFAEVTLSNGANVWLKADVLKPIDPAARVAADRASIVAECIFRERERNEIDGTGPWFVFADFLIARALIETTMANMAPQPGSLAAGPMAVTPDEWVRFLKEGGDPAQGLKPEDYDRWLTQIKGVAYSMFSDAKAFSDFQKQKGIDSKDSKFMPTYLDIFHVYLLGSAEAAVAVLNARNDDTLKNQKMDLLLGGISSPPKLETLQSRRSKYLGVPGQAKTVTEFIQSTETELRGALKVAFDLIKQHAPDELPPEAAVPSVKRVASIPTDVASLPPNGPAPFATVAIPVDKMFWPVITDDPQAMIVSYLSTGGKIVGLSGRRFFADRRGGERHHVGVDIFCREGDVVVACAPGKIVGFYSFYRRPTTGEDTFALFVAHDGVVINYGEVRRSAREEFGWRIGSDVAAGQPIARVSGTDMIHFETYVPGVTQNVRWLRGEATPQSLLNPTMLLLTLASGANRIDKNGAISKSNGSAKFKTEVGDSPPEEDLLTLARTIYGEARSPKEPAAGREAVAHVVMNRLAMKFRGETTIAGICKSRRQFSCWNDDDPSKEIIEVANRGINPVFDQCITFAEQVANGQLDDNTGGATHYYSETIARPSWAKAPAKQTAQIGSHLFFVLSGGSLAGRSSSAETTLSHGKNTRNAPPVTGPSASQPGIDRSNARRVTLLFATVREESQRPGEFFSGERSKRTTYGKALVKVPLVRNIGEVNLPFELKFFNFTIFKEAFNPAIHFSLECCEVVSKLEWLKDIQSSERSQALIFIHGFNTPFLHGVYRCAQIVWDIGYPGIPILFSWASRGEIKDYPYDQGSARLAGGAFVELLSDLHQSNVRKVHVLAHSMGSYLLLNALSKFSRNRLSRLGEIVMAAPDIDRDEYVEMASEIRPNADGMTLYASSKDKALAVAKRLAGNIPRAGDVPKAGPILVDRVDAIDASALGTDILGLNHGTFAQNKSILNDVKRLLHDSTRPPSDRLVELRGMPEGEEKTKWWRYIF